MRRRWIPAVLAVTVAAAGLAGCGGNSHHHQGETATPPADVVRPGSYPANGTIAVGDGVTVRFLSLQPAKARLQVDTAAAPAAPAGRMPIATPAHFQLENGTFGNGAVITYRLPAALTAAQAHEVIQIATQGDGANSWSPVPATVDASKRTISVTVAHFSWYEPWTWDWANIFASANQDIGQLVGKRAGPATCHSATPGWLRDTPGVDNGPALVVRGCTESEHGNLVVQLVNNRAYGLVLHYGGPIAFGWHETGSSLLDQQEYKLADALVGPSALYLPPRARASVGVLQPSSYREQDYRIDVTRASLGLDVLRTIGTDLLPDVGDKAIAKVAKACGKTLTETEKPESLTALGTIRDDGLAAVDCIARGFTEAVRDGLLDGAKVTKLGQVAKSLKKASVVGKALDFYGAEWDLGDLFVSEKWVKPNPNFGWGFSVFARTVAARPAHPVTATDLASAPVPALCQHPAGTLVDGKLPGIPAGDGFVELATQLFPNGPGYLLTDLNGDGVGDAAAVISCNRGGVPLPESIQCYSHPAGAGGLTRLGGISLETVSVPAGANPDSRDGVEAMIASGGGIDVSWLAVAKNRCEACGGFTASAHLAYDGHNVVVSNVTHRSIDEVVWTLSLDGLGPIKLGMTPDQAAAQLGIGASDGSGYGGPSCTSKMFFIDTSPTGDESQQTSIRALLDPTGHIRALEFTGPLGARTPSGIGIGSPESALVAAYGANLSSKPLFDGPGTQYVYTPTDPNLADRRLVFDVIDGNVAVMNVARTDLPLNSCDD